jgi:hypothetical protein
MHLHKIIDLIKLLKRRVYIGIIAFSLEILACLYVVPFFDKEYNTYMTFHA